MDTIVTTTDIQSQPAIVWSWLTEQHLMKTWMGEPEMNIGITTDWNPGSPIIIRGFHHVKFENRGLILKYDPYKTIRYTHLSSISRLPDVPANYSTLTFELDPKERQTVLTITVENFPNESIYKHLHLYWTTTPVIMKELIERHKI